jgi:hypothetical protein
MNLSLKEVMHVYTNLSFHIRKELNFHKKKAPGSKTGNL